MTQLMSVRRRFLSLTMAALTLIGFLASANSAVAAGLGPPISEIYAHDQLFRTIGTPADLPPVGKFDTIYVLDNGLASVAEAGPGDQAFNGGRWEVRPIVWIGIAPTQFTNAEQVLAAAQAGQIRIGDVVRHFECPLIHSR